MSDSPDRISAKEVVAALLILVLFGIGIFITLGIFGKEAESKEVVVSDAGSKDPNNLEVFVKLLTVDPIKGDTTARLEFVPHGKLSADEAGTLTQDLKLFIPSANGKTEIDMKKGKQIPPVEAVFSMYGGNAADYPFDAHTASFYVYVDKAAAEKKSGDAKPESADKPASAADEGEHAKTPATDEPDSSEIPLDVSFFGNIPGYKISVEKTKDTDATYVEGDVHISRSSTTLAFSMFVGVLMWLLSLAVLFLTLSVVLRGRKPEIAMFSFMAALLFAYYAVRNTQPLVPPIGVYSDFMAFFWTETLVGACLVVMVFTWVFRQRS
ncbi:MAG: DUF4436 family protein [Acidobacteria bacterium]|nr:DUF4436 family protein [Acidobacteriota bacterium]